MKRTSAKWASGVLMGVAMVFATALSAFFVHKPEVPAELLKKQ